MKVRHKSANDAGSNDCGAVFQKFSLGKDAGRMRLILSKIAKQGCQREDKHPPKEHSISQG
jgi:hypothetical protein